MIQTNYSEVKYLLLQDNDTAGSIAVIEVNIGEDISEKVRLAITEHYCVHQCTIEFRDTVMDLYRDEDMSVKITDYDGDEYAVHVGLSLIALYR
jgi:hypothetical protein